MKTNTKQFLDGHGSLLRQMLANVDAQLSALTAEETPVAPTVPAGKPAELSFEEVFALEKRLDETVGLIQIDIDKEGNATLTGLKYEDLRDIITAASLQAYEDKYKPELVADDDPLADIKRANGRESHAWYVRRRLLVDWLDDAMSTGINEHNHKFHGSPRYNRARRPRAPRAEKA